MYTVSRKCDLSIEELLRTMDRHAILLEESGAPAKEQWWQDGHWRIERMAHRGVVIGL